jgi:hypothetical protein
MDRPEVVNALFSQGGGILILTSCRCIVVVNKRTCFLAPEWENLLAGLLLSVNRTIFALNGIARFHLYRIDELQN